MRLAYLAGLAVTAAALTACRDSTAPASVAGTYVLQSVNGTALPVVTLADPLGRFVDADTLVLKADGTWADLTSGDAGGTARGTWTIVPGGAQFTMTSNNGALGTWWRFGPAGPAPVTGRTLTITVRSGDVGGIPSVWAFARQ